jgi:hypothetical protein
MSFEKKTLENGATNPKYVDLLDEDPPIAGQKYGVFSFLTPGNILKKRESWLFWQFVKQWDFTKFTKVFEGFLHFLSTKYNLRVESLLKDFAEFLKEEQEEIKKESVIEDDFKSFLDKNEDTLNEQFSRENQFQTNVHGLKQRGNFNTLEEAQEHAKKTRNRDPNHSTFVGSVGIWMAWDPDPYKTGAVEFMEEQLNELHKKKLENEAKAKEEFDRRIRETKEKAIRENMDKAEKSGNKLTQSINEKGELIGVQQLVDFESREVASPDVQEELFQSLKKKANSSS